MALEISNKEMNEFKNVVDSLEASVALIKGVGKTLEK